MVFVRTHFFNLRIPAGGNATAPRVLVVEDGRLAEVTPAGQETAAEGEQWRPLLEREPLGGTRPSRSKVVDVAPISSWRELRSMYLRVKDLISAMSRPSPAK
jgi:hypothetical protein